MTVKYRNFKELVAAFASGELDRAAYQLIIDNDCSRLAYCGPLPDEMKQDTHEADTWLARKQAEVREWFCGEGHSDWSAACLIANAPRFY